MNAIRHIRKNVLKLSQGGLADLTGVTQATVSRWETGELSPGLDELTRIRDEAQRLGAEWDDSLFFETPQPAPVRAGA